MDLKEETGLKKKERKKRARAHTHTRCSRNGEKRAKNIKRVSSTSLNVHQRSAMTAICNRICLFLEKKNIVNPRGK